MFLRQNDRPKDGKVHTYWSLVESVRTPNGPRQRTICYLGELNASAEARWRKTIQIFNAQGESEQLALFPAGTPLPAEDQVVAIRLDRVRWTRPRSFGDVWLGWTLWQRLGLDAFWAAALDSVPADVPWSRITALLAINRLCAPGSELAIEARWYGSTALDELLGVEAARVNTDRLYRCLDLLLPHKAAVEQHLSARYGELFGAQYAVLLYDLTSTYVEGLATDNPRMQRGYSRDHRPDCKQVVLALVVSPDGFPFAYEVFPGNRTDVTTLADILDVVEAKYGRAERVWVFDRGLVRERNLALLRARADRSRALDWIQIGAVAGPTIELPSVALRSANLRIQGSGQGSVSASTYLAELPALVDEIAAGTLCVNVRPMALADVELAFTTPDPAGERTVLVP